MDCIAAFESVGTYRGAALLCGVDPKTMKRKVQAHRDGVLDEERARRAVVAKNTDVARLVVTDKIRETKGRMSAKRLLPIARAVGYQGSPRNLRRLVAEVKKVLPCRAGSASASSGGVVASITPRSRWALQASRPRVRFSMTGVPLRVG